LPGRAVCVLPSTGQSAGEVQIIVADSDSVVQRHRIGVTGERVPVSRDGCAGWESARSGSDGRIYMRSEYACEGGIQRATSGLISMIAPNEWADVQTTVVDDQSTVIVQRYRETVPPAVIAAEVNAALSDRSLAISSARIGASGVIQLQDIVEASGTTFSSTVEAWLLERRQGYRLQGKHVESLAAAGVPTGIIDMVVALSYPGAFAAELTSRRIDLYPSHDTPVNSSRVASPDYVAPPNSNTFVEPYRGSYYGGFGGYFRSYRSYAPFGLYYGGASFFGAPLLYNPAPAIIIIRDGRPRRPHDGDPGGGDDGGNNNGGGTQPPPASLPPGRLINGRGYTNGVQNDNSSAGAQTLVNPLPRAAAVPGNAPTRGTNGRAAVPRSGGGSNASNGARVIIPNPASSGSASGRTTLPPSPLPVPRVATPRNSGGASQTNSSGTSRSGGGSAGARPGGTAKAGASSGARTTGGEARPATAKPPASGRSGGRQAASFEMTG
jgi:hypothetical protein